MPLALPGLALGLTVLVTFLVFWGMHHGSNTWLRTLLEEYTKPRGSFVKRAVTAPARYAIKGVLRVERVVRAALATWLVANTMAVAGWFYELEVLALGVAHEIRDLGLGIEHGVADLAHRWIPEFVGKKTAPIERTAKAGFDKAERARAQGVAERAARQKGIDKLRRDDAKARRLLERGIEAGIASHVLPKVRANDRAVDQIRHRELPRIRTRERAAEHAFAFPSKVWIRRVANAMWVTTIFGLLTKYLIHRFPWMFCRNVNRLAKVICPLDDLAIDAIEALLLGTVVLEDYRTLIRLMQDAERGAIDEIERLLSVF